MKKGQFVVVIDSYEGPFDSQEAAEFFAKERISQFAVKGAADKSIFAGVKRKAVVARVESVQDGGWGLLQTLFGGGPSAA